MDLDEGQDLLTSVIAIRTGECQTHCHDLESVDMQKKKTLESEL